MAFTGINTSSAKSIPQQNLADNTRMARWPSTENLRVKYGVIEDVSDKTSQVKVRLITGPGSRDIFIDNYIPLSNPLSEIHLLWGALRKGLAVRVFYRGKEDPKTGIAEVVGDETYDFLRQQPFPNILNTGPYQILSGGLIQL